MHVCLVGRNLKQDVGVGLNGLMPTIYGSVWIHTTNPLAKISWGGYNVSSQELIS